MKTTGFISCALLTLTLICLSVTVHAQPFIHPGIDQQSKDLAWMKKKVLNNEQPWKAAFDRLKASTDTAFTAKAHTHVLRGPFGRPNIGGDDLSKSANMAYNNALIWYITGDKTYAAHAIDILNAWSPVLWDFDYNDAKLLAAWTGHVLCNAAEILRYTNAGWKTNDINAFTNMLMTVYYPLLRYYFPQANGNWDGAIIHSLLAMAIFTDNRKMYNNAVDHYLHGPVNGSLFKYVYPSGQCQESMRDQGHVQLGLGEFAGAAQVAWTQGTDLLSIGNNRLALGFEYTAGYILGKTPQCYGKISDRAKVLREDYEFVYRHYTSHGLSLPNVSAAADSTRLKASRSVLTAVRAPLASPAINTTVKASAIGYVAGAGTAASAIPADAIQVMPGQSVQDAVDQAAGTGKWVLLKAGIHTLPASLKIPAGTTLAGEGLATILFLNPSGADRDLLVNAGDDLHDVSIRDMIIECSNKTDQGTDPNGNRSFKGGYNRGGIIFRTSRNGQIKNINLLNLTVQNATYNGVFISGGSNITVKQCNFSENGSTAVPGPKLQHNLLLTHCSGVTVQDSRLVTSPNGSGLALDHCSDGRVTNCEIARNGYYGILVTESSNINIQGNLVEGNDRSGVMMEWLHNGSSNITVTGNRLTANAGYGIEMHAVTKPVATGNVFSLNGHTAEQQLISPAKTLIME